MALFNMHYDRPGPGVDPDTPRKKGAARFLEVLGRDMTSFWLASFLAGHSRADPHDPFRSGGRYDRGAPALRFAGYHPAQPAG